MEIKRSCFKDNGYALLYDIVLVRYFPYIYDRPSIIVHGDKDFSDVVYEQEISRFMESMSHQNDLKY